MQQKAFFKLMAFQYTITYKRGATNKAADALSRRPQHNALMAVSEVKPKWLETVLEGYQQDPVAKKLLTELAISPNLDQEYSLNDGVIRYKGRVWLGHNKEAHKAILMALHGSALGGHSGFQATYHRVKQFSLGQK